MADIRVTVGVPVRNGGALLASAMASILGQSERNLEIVISDNSSDDGSSDYLRALAAQDDRIRYFRQEPALSAYDNFRFVLARARGQYFMWAAHDDTRDLDFIACLANALDQDPKAILAFGDLNIVTPDDAPGKLVDFPFQTAGMGIWSRLARGSRLQCFHIYGLWRTSVARSIPYAYCAWWPDLPMMLAAAIAGTFIHVPGTRFHYLELPKSNITRVKSQDYAARFNLVFAVAELVMATYRACAGSGGRLLGAYAAGLIVLKQAINLPGFIYRRLRGRTVAG